MKKTIINTFFTLLLGVGMTSCGDSFLETDYFGGPNLETGLNTVSKVSKALNGTYYNLYYYKFAGNYAINIGDIPTDIAYWNADKQHFNNIYQYTFSDTDSYLRDIWEYGYKTADNAARIIAAGKQLYASASEEEKKELDLCLAEAHALRGYAQLMLTNIYGHQVKVAGEDFSNTPGIVIIDEPKQPQTQVSRSTVGQSYEAIVNDLNKAIEHFDAAGGDRGSLVFLNKAATYGLLARTALYLEDWDNAIDYADKALKNKEITTLTYGESYKDLYKNEKSNKESFFALAITQTDNWSANSSGTLWSTYCYSPSPKLQALYQANDCRKSLIAWDKESTPDVPVFKGGKFSHFDSNNPAYATHYIVNAPEMFLIQAEANLMSSNGSLDKAKNALLTVAKRNADIQSVNDLPATKEEVMAFIKDERARELFQEGFRLFDLRRWGDKVSVYAIKSPEVAYTYNDYQISDLIFPIPSAEINAGFGVEQNDWINTLPER